MFSSHLQALQNVRHECALAASTAGGLVLLLAKASALLQRASWVVLFPQCLCQVKAFEIRVQSENQYEQTLWAISYPDQLDFWNLYFQSYLWGTGSYAGLQTKTMRLLYKVGFGASEVQKRLGFVSFVGFVSAGRHSSAISPEQNGFGHSWKDLWFVAQTDAVCSAQSPEWGSVPSLIPGAMSHLSEGLCCRCTLGDLRNIICNIHASPTTSVFFWVTCS